MILAYTGLAFGWVAFFGVGSSAFPASGTRMSVQTIKNNNRRVTVSPSLTEYLSSLSVRNFEGNDARDDQGYAEIP